MTFILLGFLGLILWSARSYWLEHSDSYTRTIKALRWPMLPMSLAMIPVIVIVGGLGYTYLPFGDVGWWSLLGGEGNALLGQTSGGDSGSGGGLVSFLSGVLPAALLFVAPLLAHSEERSFRSMNHWTTKTKRLKKATWFGLVHLIVGVPLGIVPALIVLGLYFDVVYDRACRKSMQRGVAQMRLDAGLPAVGDVKVKVKVTQDEYLQLCWDADRDGVDTSAAAHTVWNWIILAVVLVTFLGG